VFYNRIEDTFTPVIIEKMTKYGCEMVTSVVLEDDHVKITSAIGDMLDAGAELVLCTGGMSVDPDDKTPLAIKNAADIVVSYGAPMLPGAMFMLAYTADGKPICGLPGCVM
jgi:molybdopterin biosynthesis enzyme